MANNIAVSITADVADLQVKRAIMSAELKAATKDLNDFARTAKSGMTDELKTKMLAAADAAQKTRNQIALVDKEVRNLNRDAGGVPALAKGAGEASAAMGALHGSTSTAVREVLTLGREAARGNFTRMAGSATILAQAMGLLTPQVLGAAAAIVAIAAPIIAVEAAANSAESDLALFRNNIELTGNYAGLTATQFEAMAHRIAKASDTGLGDARTALEMLIRSGRFTGEELDELGRDMTKFSQLTGEKTKEVAADFIKMADGPTRYAEEFNRTYHALTVAQLEHIANLEKEGRKSEATAELVKDLTRWIDTQTVHMGGWASMWHTVAGAIDDAWESLKRFSAGSGQAERLKDLNASIAEFKQHGEIIGSPNFNLAAAEKERDALLATTKAQSQAAEQTSRTTRVQAEGQEAYEKSHETMLSLRSSALNAKDAVKALHDEMAKRLAANPDDAEAKDYYANQAKYDHALEHKMDPGDFKKGHAAKGPDVVQEWSEQFHAAEVLAGKFFDDETQKELAFWQSKVGLVRDGSKQWLEVQSKIYDAEKSLAHQAYDNKVAGFNEQLEAARDNWAEEQKIYAEKLAYIKETYKDTLGGGQNSKEYLAAKKEEEAAEREHQRTLTEIARNADKERLAELKDTLAANKSIRQADAATAEAIVNQNAKYSPVLGEVKAASQIRAIHQQLNAQDLADLEATYAKEDELRQKDIADAKAGSTQYATAVEAKKRADEQFYNQHRELENRMVQQDVQDQLKIAQSWHQVIDPLVSTTGSQVQGLIERTETWRQAILRLGEGALSVVIGAIERMVEKWIVAQITQQGAQRAAALTQVTSYAGIAGAAGIASMAGAPFPIDLTAPEFGAAMSAAALGYSSLASLDVGTNQVPRDMVAQIHADERVMPAADNRKLMAAVDRGTGGAGGASGDTHNTYAPTIHAGWGSTKELVQALVRDHAGEFFGMMRRAARDGVFRGV